MNLYNDASLAMIPSAVKDGKLYSIRPTDGSGDFTFSRGSNLAATRVDVNGLIEKGRENLLLQSNQFDTTWGLGGGTLTSGQAGYDGTNNAWLFNYASAANICNQANTQSGVQTLSVYAKGNVSNGLRMYAFGTSNCYAYFDLNIGVVETTIAVIDANIEDKGNGWYRCSMTFNQTNSNIYLYLSDNNNSNAVSGSIYIQDAQLEVGLVATDYIETTTTTAVSGITEDLPRLDYSGGASCPSLLLEPQRTNLVTQSEYINSGGGWSYTGGLTTEVNSIDSPEGLTSGTKVVIGSNQYGELRSPSISQSATTSAISLFAKAGDLGWCIVQYSDSTVSNYVRVWFNISTGAVGSNTQVGWSIVGNPTIEDYGSGWYRCNIVLTTTAASTNRGVMFGATGDSSFGATQNSYFYAYGFQLEEGSYPTSYIPTYGSAVTRSIDICTKTSATSLIGQTQGTFFIEFVPLTLDSKDIFYFNQTTSSSVHLYGTNRLTARIRIGSFNFSVLSNTISVAQTYKVAVVYDESFGLKLFVNGVKYENNTPFTFAAALDRIVINSNAYWTGDGAIENKQSLVFKTALTDSECIALTTL